MSQIGPNDICVSFMMLDKFGDGWNSAKLIGFDYLSTYKSFSSTCNENPAVSFYCFDPTLSSTGDSLTVTVTGYMPSQPWEVRQNISVGYLF